MWIGRLSPASSMAGTAARQIASKPFMSTAPRPMARPFSTRSRKGSPLHSWPSTGTQSVWPDRTTPPSVFGPMVARIAALSPASFGWRETSIPSPAR